MNLFINELWTRFQGFFFGNKKRKEDDSEDVRTDKNDDKATNANDSKTLTSTPSSNAKTGKL